MFSIYFPSYRLCGTRCHRYSLKVCFMESICAQYYYCLHTCPQSFMQPKLKEHVTKLLISLKQGRVNCATFLFGRDTCSASDMTQCFLSSASQRMQRLQLKTFKDLMYCTSNNALKATYPSSPTV